MIESTGRARSLRLPLLGMLFGMLLPACALAAEPLRVAAASSLQFVLPEIVAGFEAAQAIPVQVSYGSTGTLARQIERGAPFDLLLSANAAHVQHLAERGLTAGAGRIYAYGRLAFYVPAGSPVDPDTALTDLPAEVAAGRLRRFALAHPENAPYGVAARQVLERNGAWATLAPVRVIGESVTQAARFLSSGAAEAGLIAESLAARPELAEHGSFRVVDPAWHAPLEQRLAVLRGARPGSAAFADYLLGAAARALFARHGFGLPE